MKAAKNLWFLEEALALVLSTHEPMKGLKGDECRPGPKYILIKYIVKMNSVFYVEGTFLLLRIQYVQFHFILEDNFTNSNGKTGKNIVLLW